MEARTGFLRQRVDRRVPSLLAELIAHARDNAELDLDLVPVAVYWGRGPQKEGSLLRSSSRRTGVRRPHTQVLHGAHQRPQCRAAIRRSAAAARLPGGWHRGKPCHPPRLACAAGPFPQSARRDHRPGPLAPAHRSSRRCCARASCASPSCRKCASASSRAAPRSSSPRNLPTKLPPTTRTRSSRWAARVLGRIWNRLYDGVIVKNLDVLARAAEGAEIVYVPCHRSHMDYLLLVVRDSFRGGRAVPHIAAGREPQPAGDRPLPAQRRRLLHAPSFKGSNAVCGRLHEVPTSA